ncbi:ribosomal protein S6 kinase alpha-5-like [Corticium candelabrum]|uniref:ribosomal protein S6 kinase alpha-5-like n=1 Tax=Corticium candelabrum TaxID=121492 RepID=UPI002E255E42|nr:ribosomal protein S6 kinase alpha-5-like [Corticium candelabrum]
MAAQDVAYTTVEHDLQSDFGVETEEGKVSLRDFDLLRVLGTGAYGKVFLVRKKTGKDCDRLFAMKVLKKATIVQKAKATEHTMTERQVLEAVRESPFLVTLHYAFQTDAKLHLILDYVCGGELFTHLYQRDHFNEAECRIYVGEVLLAIEHLHKLGIIYRDLKLENILLDAEGHVVLTDFGLSKEMIGDEGDRTYSYCGTVEYMAPEVVKSSKKGHDKAVDWWSLGVLLYELLSGASPFTVEGEDNSQIKVSRRILRCEPFYPTSFSVGVKDLLRGLLAKDAKRRLGCGRNGVEDIKQHQWFDGLDWACLKSKQMSPPFVPVIRDELDVSNFSEEFTRQTPTDSPAVVPSLSDKDIFRGYSFVAPAVLFDKNLISNALLDSREFFRGVKRDRPAHTWITNSHFLAKYEVLEELLGEGTYSTCRYNLIATQQAKISNDKFQSEQLLTREPVI